MDAYYDLIDKDHYNISGDPYGLTEGPDDINDDLDKIIINVATSPDPLCNLPVLSAGAYNEAVASVSSTMSSFANAVSPLACGAALQGVTAAFAKIQESICTVPTVATAIKDATANAISIAAKVMDTVALDSGAVSATLQPSLAETVEPILSAYAVDTIASTTQEIAKVSDTVSAISLATKRALTFDASLLTDALSRVFEAIDIYAGMHDRFMDAMNGMTEIFDSIWERSCNGLRRFTSFFFHLFLSIWRWKRRRSPCLPKITLYLPAIRVNVGLTQPEQVREFAPRIQQIFLFRRQDRGASEEDVNAMSYAVAC